MSAAFTCLSCHVAYQTPEGQKDHFRSEWHRYNLMRKVAELPPVSQETFNERASQVETQVAQMAKSKEEKKKFCKPCGRPFANQMSYDNHLNSKKHIEKVATYTEASNNRKNLAIQKSQEMQSNIDDDDDDDSSSADKKEKLHCSACSVSFKSQASYFNHMKSNQHLRNSAMALEPQRASKSSKAGGHTSSYVEDSDDDDEDEYEEVDWEGEAIELQDCLFCTHHSATLRKKLEHMSEKHSFFIPDLEYCSDVPGLITYLGEKIGCGYECIGCSWVGKRCPTLDAVWKHMKDKGHCFLNISGDMLLEYEDFYDYSSTYPDAGEGVDSDEEVVMNILHGDDYQLVLPSGAIVGHRSLMRYYRQKLNPERRLVVKKTPGRSFTSILSQYRALGWNGATQADVVRKSRDLKYMKQVQSHHHMRLGVKANKLQHHFRQQNPV